MMNIASRVMSILILIAFYGFIISKVKGRCSRFEYIAVNGTILFLIVLLFAVLRFFNLKYYSYPLALLPLFAVYILLFVLVFRSLKLTIMRFYDLDMDGWHLLTTLIPIYGIVIQIYLFAKKGEEGINEFDTAIDYAKFLKGLNKTESKQVLDVCGSIMFSGKEEIPYQRYLDTYEITISAFADKENRVIRYLLDTFEARREGNRNLVIITFDEFSDMIRNLGLIYVKGSFYLLVRNTEVFIRHEDFKYTLMFRREDRVNLENEIALIKNEALYTEHETYCIYKKIRKGTLLEWIKNAV